MPAAVAISATITMTMRLPRLFGGGAPVMRAGDRMWEAPCELYCGGCEP
jgi:hypothetical protein